MDNLKPEVNHQSNSIKANKHENSSNLNRHSKMKNIDYIFPALGQQMMGKSVTTCELILYE